MRQRNSKSCGIGGVTSLGTKCAKIDGLCSISVSMLEEDGGHKREGRGDPTWLLLLNLFVPRAGLGGRARE